MIARLPLPSRNLASLFCEEQAKRGPNYCIINNMKRIYLLFLFVALAVILSSCQKITSTPSTGLANPASVYCGENEGTLEIRTAADGGQIGVCKFKDGSECEEWAYFRKECKPGDVFP